MRGGFLVLLSLLWISVSTYGQQPVEKNNHMRVYMHYMPWFETPETIGRWGWHWTMNTRNPDKVDESGKREIASHYYPLIGTYASRDKDVIEYHLLLMKLSGIDGVLINWYGVQGGNTDVEDLLKSSNAIISQVNDFGLEFGVVMEDRFSRSIEDAKANMAYLKENYFGHPAYIRYGAEEDPLVAVFGPITFEEPRQWAAIMEEAGEDVEFLTLWHETEDAGSHADGAYSWIFEDEESHLEHLEKFYAQNAPELETVMGSAYPGFHDFYREGGAGNGYFYIPHKKGATLKKTLSVIKEHQEHIDMVQLATWNDFGEGTVFEPTIETGFSYLQKIQEYTGVKYKEQELALVYKLFKLRKEYSGDPAIQERLDVASVHLSNLEIEKAAGIINNY
ncbi:glycoside hydrolase family 71/99-like protein [Nafulsella turpanensis]|uniref:glycoside hydrolase family 71/99-like protein n=1 Tax=Nafulsella turpanensis TaxID=1265690 RepID=UPI0009DAA1A5|nr:glycoside hydrolase family 71/99-like protein [Nafulsella turpanensis]